MVDVTDDGLEDTPLHVGDHVHDCEADDERTMLVTATPVKKADEYVIDGEDKDGLKATVADYNEDYPSDDVVVEVVYPGRTDVALDGAKRYAFPRSRLARVAAVHDVEEGDA